MFRTIRQQARLCVQSLLLLYICSCGNHRNITTSDVQCIELTCVSVLVHDLELLSVHYECEQCVQVQNVDSNADVRRNIGRSSCIVVSHLTAVHSYRDSEQFKQHTAFVSWSSLVFCCNKYGHCMHCSLKKFHGLQ